MTLPPAVALALLFRLSLAAEPAADPIDVSAVRDQLVVVADGKGHYIAVIPFGDSIWEHLYWSADGKDFYQQRVFGGGSSGTESFERSFWEPRVRGRSGASFGMHDGTYKLWCGERTTVFTSTEPGKAKALLAGAKFHPPLWKYRAYALARDDSGTYYYVDRRREDGSMEFRLYSGPRGSMKPLKMVNVVSDSEGDIFSTRSGELRLVLDKKESAWVQKGKRQTLKSLPVEDNVALIYDDLGVYSGQPLGTPCDLL
ncbi:MAG: hypothetical protein ACXWLG_12430 [Myxococcaceae bacterium]